MNKATAITGTPHVYQAIAAVMLDMTSEGIAKKSRNSQQGYNFRGIDDVYNALAPVMARHQLCMLPRVVSRECVERQSAKGSALFYTTVEAEFDLVSAVDGSTHIIRTVGEAMDSADKSSNKAMSAAYKYAAMQAFCIPTEGDNDADASHHEVTAAPRQAPRADPAPSVPMISADQRLTIADLSQKAKVEMSNILGRAKVSDLAELTENAADQVIKKLKLTLDQRKPATVGDILDDSIPY